MLLPPQSLHSLLRRWCSQRVGALRGFMTAEGCGAGDVARPDALPRVTPRSSCLRRFPCGPPACPSSILFLPAAAASGPSVWSDILLCGLSSLWRLCVQSVRCFHSRVALCSVSLDPTVTLLIKGDNTTERGASLRGRAATKLSDTGKTSAHNASHAPLLTLITCQADTSSPVSSFDSRVVSWSARV